MFSSGRVEKVQQFGRIRNSSFQHLHWAIWGSPQMLVLSRSSSTLQNMLKVALEVITVKWRQTALHGMASS